MQPYVLFTDSGCDMAPEKLKEWGVSCIPMTFRFGSEDKEYRNEDLATHDFYERLRGGETSKTSAINTETFKEWFEPALKDGNDILYVAFSSGLSGTYQMALLAAEELKETYPDRTVTVVDTLAASAGHGLLVYLAVQKKQEGATLAEVAEYLNDIRLNVALWFTVDDLQHLKRGGRISPTVALVGGMLGIKPVLHMDDEGHLISKSKVRGRQAALQALVDKVKELGIDPQNGPIFVSHGDCIDDVKRLETMMKDQLGADITLISDIGPVIGSHSGPGTVAIFFIAKNR